MARPRKTQEPAPAPVEETFSLVINDEDDTPDFDEAEETFNDADLEEITMIAEQIVSQNRDASKGLENAPSSPSKATSGTSDTSAVLNALESLRLEMTTTLDSILSFQQELSSRVTSLEGRDDPSKVLYALTDLVEERFGMVLDRFDKMESQTTSSVADPYQTAPAPSFAEETEKIRKWLQSLPPGRSALLSSVVESIDKRLNIGVKEVLNIVMQQADLVGTQNGKIFRV
jgi:hypothetical protein